MALPAPRPLLAVLPTPVEYDGSGPGPRSPLDQLGLVVQNRAAPPPPFVDSKPAPPLDLNLFRSPSIYSVESSLDGLSLTSEEAADATYSSYGRYGFEHSLASHYDFVSEPEAADADDSDNSIDDVPTGFRRVGGRRVTAGGSSSTTPATPRAVRHGSTVRGGSPTPSGAATPTTVRDVNPFDLYNPYPSLANGNDAYASSSSAASAYSASASTDALRSAINAAQFTLRPVPGRSARSHSGMTTDPSPPLSARSASEPIPPAAVTAQHATLPSMPQTTTVPDTASVHGEQGVDWGEDENGFEWLDTEGAPEASNGAVRKGPNMRLGLVNPKRLSRLSGLRNAITVSTLGVGSNGINSSHNNNSSAGTSPSSVSSAPTSASVSPVRLSSVDESHWPGAGAGVAAGATSPEEGPSSSSVAVQQQQHPHQQQQQQQQPPRPRKKRPIVIPRRAAPPPPPGAPLIPPVLRATPPLDMHHSGASSPSSGTITPPQLPSNILPGVVVIHATPPRGTPLTAKSSRSLLRSESHESAVTSPKNAFGHGNGGHDQRSVTAAGTPETIPRGRNAKQPLREIDVTDAQQMRIHAFDNDPAAAAGAGAGSGPRRSSDAVKSPISAAAFAAHLPRRGSEDPRAAARAPPSSPSSSSTASSPVRLSTADRTPSDLVLAGLQRREAGDLPRAAWCFMKASESGSSIGQMYWGLALRHGSGIGRDERRGFNELVHACDRILTGSPIDLRAAAGTLLTPMQLKDMSPHLSVGLFEAANCFLDGVGVQKRNSDMALEYLRMAGSLGDVAAQEQLGYVLSKGVAGVKKDMREAAKWYRAAIAAGSTTPGLAWVWKDKYNGAG